MMFLEFIGGCIVFAISARIWLHYEGKHMKEQQQLTDLREIDGGINLYDILVDRVQRKYSGGVAIPMQPVQKLIKKQKELEEESYGKRENFNATQVFGITEEEEKEMFKKAFNIDL